MRALRFLGMGMGVASQERPACRGLPTAHDPPTPKTPARGALTRSRQLRAQDLPRYAFVSGEGTT